MKCFIPLLACAASLVTAAHASEDPVVAKGRYLARAGDCVACHTAKEGKPFAGGLPMATPIGVVYSTNITPDRQTGIGAYSLGDFDKAVRHGVAKAGYSLYPAMPYPSYARVSDEDMQALYAYFMHGVAPVNQANRASDIPWPLSMRWPLHLWRNLFAPSVDTAAAVKPMQDPMLARGAYLVEGLGHCGACHTPRAFSLQEKALSANDGEAFLAGGDVQEGWVGKNLRGDHRDGLGSWSEAELVDFFKTGRTDKAAAFGSMSEVVVHSLQYLTDKDRVAIARYLKHLPAVNPDNRPFATDPATYQALHEGKMPTQGARIYADNCMACHRSDGKGYAQVFPALAGNPVLNVDDPQSLIRLVLEGGTLPSTHAAPTSFSMPPLGWRLSDDEVAQVLSFVRSAWGNRGESVSVSVVATVRKSLVSDALLAPGMLKVGASPSVEP